ncbi:MAG: NAD-binding protein [Rhizobiales bacterium]|nr:NAD-binding protein [Hyphomicrobiales bacterium]
MAGEKETVGIIGVGRMGLAMLKNMIKHGHTVLARDVDETQIAEARKAGATVVDTPAEIGKTATFVIAIPVTDEQVNDVLLGPNGLIETVRPGTIVAVSSTVSPDTVQALDEKFRAKGANVLDAPLCRGRAYADAGTLLALVGGKPDVVERGRAVYGTFCSDIAHLGEVGHGQVGKAMNNMLLWINSIGLIEAGQLAATTGIDLPTLRDALQMSSGKSQALEDWDHTTFTFALKDMQIVSQMADKAGLSLPMAGAVREMVKEAKRLKATNPPAWTGRKT